MGRKREHLKIGDITVAFNVGTNDELSEKNKASFSAETKNRTWLYYRLSRDDDPNMNSLENQRNILVDYAQAHNFKIVGESFDDGISGMHFRRAGFDKLWDAVEQQLIDIVLVKDLSRFGRHKSMTAMYIEELTKANIRVISATENLDSLNENHDFVIAIKQLLNDQYSKDLSRKIRFGYEQKFREGFVIHPPYGYIKDKNTSEITLDDSAELNVKIIFDMFLKGENATQIAQFLTKFNRTTPSNKQKEWSSNTVKTILKNKAYIGILECGKNRKLNDADFIHTEFYPKIIDDQLFNQAQKLLAKNEKPPKNKAVKQKYSGLLFCQDCSELCYSISKKDGVYYVCKSYHKFGKTACSSHLISEPELERQIKQYFILLKSTIDKRIAIINDELVFAKRRSSNKHQKEKKLLEMQINLQRSIERYEKYLPESSEAHDDIIKAINKEKEELQAINNKIDTQDNKISATEKKTQDLKILSKKIDKVLMGDIVLDDIFKIIDRISLKVADNGETVVHIDLKKPYYGWLSDSILQ